MAAGRHSYGAINLRQVPLRLREQFRALCALRGTTMTRGLIQLMEAEVQSALDSGEYQPVITWAREREARATGQRQLWPENTPPE